LTERDRILPVSYILTAIIMFVFWVLLSGKFTFILLCSGVVSSLFVAYLSHDLLFGKVKFCKLGAMILRFICYLPWLFWQVILANLDVAYRTLHPSMPIDPCVITFDADLETDAALVILANSITLTPGTVTIEADKNRQFRVHALSSGAAEDLLKGEMMRRVKKIEGGL